MFRSLKSNFSVLVHSLLFVGSLAVLSATAFGQSPEPQPIAYQVTASTGQLRHAAVKAAPVVATSLELKAFELVNVQRAKHGLRPLVWDADLTRMARLHSENMARQNFFSHQAPDGSRLRERSRASGFVGFKRMGENLAFNKGFADAASCAVVGWMRSEGHRSQILDGEFTRSGLGIARSEDGRVYFTQVFVVH